LFPLLNSSVCGPSQYQLYGHDIAGGLEQQIENKIYDGNTDHKAVCTQPLAVSISSALSGRWADEQAATVDRYLPGSTIAIRLVQSSAIGNPLSLTKYVAIDFASSPVSGIVSSSSGGAVSGTKITVSMISSTNSWSNIGYTDQVGSFSVGVQIPTSTFMSSDQ
jgi:hypothetical protein